MEPEVTECVEQICIAVSCIAPVAASLAIISEMEEFQRALWETEAQREEKERRLRFERKQRARLKLEKSRQELEDRVRRRQEARREERGVRGAAPMVSMRRAGKQAGGISNNPAIGFRGHHEATSATTAHPQSRLPFANTVGGSTQHGAPPGMRPPSRERNVATVDLGGSLDQSLAFLRAQALALAQDAGFAPTETTDLLPEMTGTHVGAAKWGQFHLARSSSEGGRSTHPSGWPISAQPNPRLSAGLARVQAAQNDLEQLRQQNLLDLHGRRAFARTTPPEKSDASVSALSPRVGADSGSGSGSSSGSGWDVTMNHGMPGAGRSSVDENSRRRSSAMLGRGLEYGRSRGAGLMSQRGRQQLGRATSEGGRRGSGTGSRPGSGQEVMPDPTWRLGTGAHPNGEGSTPSEAAARASAAAAAAMETLKREELHRIRHENTRLLREVAETGAKSPVPRAETIDGSPFYQFRMPVRQSSGIADEPESSNSVSSSRGGQGRGATARVQQSVAGGGNDRVYDFPGSSRRQSSSDSDASDIDGTAGGKPVADSAFSAGMVDTGEVGTGSDVTTGSAACEHVRGSKIEQVADPSRHPEEGAGGETSTQPKRFVSTEARASTRGNWHGIRGLLAEHGALGISGQGLSEAAGPSGSDSDKREDTAQADASTEHNGGGAGRWQDNRAELDMHSQVQKRLGEIHTMVLDTVRWEKKKERRAEARDERKSTFRSASLDVASRAFERGRPDLLYSSQFR